MADPVPLSCEHLSVRYGRTRVLEDVSFVVPAGGVYALLGPQRRGQVVAGALPRRPAASAAAAAPILFGRRRRGGDRAPLMERVGVVPEEPDAPPELSPSTPAWISSRGCTGAGTRDGARARLRRFAVPMDTPFGRLSKGQKGAVIARAGPGARARAADPRRSDARPRRRGARRPCSTRSSASWPTAATPCS